MHNIKAEFEEKGFFAPIDVLPASSLADVVNKHDQLQLQVKAVFGVTHRFKLHLLVNWLADIVRHHTIVDAVEQIIGPDILCWSTDFFIKPAYDPSFVSLHQDCTYAGLTPFDGVVNVWVALTPSSSASGCLQVIPGSHKFGQLAHTRTDAENNMLFFGQTIDRAFGPDELVDIELHPGQASIHHMVIAHGSQPNMTDLPRIGYVVRYMHPGVKQIKGMDSATLVRGQDTYGHFEREPWPEQGFSPTAIDAFKKALARPSALG